MKKIIISLAMIAAVGAIVVGATTAYFSDTETSTGNTISAGALDLKLNGANGEPVSAVVNIGDMKPSQTWYSGPITLEVYNNPGKLYKHIVKDFTCGTGDLTEPEQEAEELSGVNDYLPGVTWFDLEVWVDKNQNGTIEEDEWVVIIPDEEITVDEIASHWIYLGTYGESLETNKIVIRQSFHMKAEAGNEYQGDSCTFTEEFMVLQTNAPHPNNTLAVLELDNKTDGDWQRINDDRIGYMTYNTAGSAFDYNFTGQGLNANTEYCLIYYADPWPGTNGFDLKCGATDGSGNINLSGSQDIGSIPVASDGNYPDGAKIWLVLGNDYDTSSNKMTKWNQSEYLYEANLITYTEN